MLFLAIIAVLMAVLIGLAVKHAMGYWRMDDLRGGYLSITWVELAAVSVIMAFVITPTVLGVGKKLSVDNIVTYQQFLNGVETKAVDDVTTCRAGHAGDDENDGKSNCHWVYDSGDYSYEVTYTELECTPDGDGGSDCKTVTKCCHTEWADIYTPYTTREHTYAIKSSFGFKENDPYHFGTVYVDKDPEPYGKKPIPGNLPRGAPADWLDAKTHLDAGDPRPVTVLDKYDNYILASDDEVLKSYSADITRFKDAGLLPQHTAGIMSDPISGPSKSQAKKLSFIGVDVPNEQEWQDALMRFNAALGMELQGDMHVVLVDSAKITSLDAVPYVNAVKAYWQGPSFEKRALAKNGVILVLGIANNSTIEWAESTTGMPFGNELMAQFIHDNLPGTALDPKAVFGQPRTVITGSESVVTHPSPQGVVENIMFETAPFDRASMSCEDKDESCVGFKDLIDTIDPTTGHKIIMVVITTLLACLLWFLVGAGSFVDESVTRVLGRYGFSKNSRSNLYDPPSYRDRDHEYTGRKGKQR